MTIYLAVRFTPFDDHLIDHFMSYYLNQGVCCFLVNFNCKLSDAVTLENFITKVTTKYTEYIKFNVGPNGIESTESSNINMLKNLVTEHVSLDDDFILPADSDELHEFDRSKTVQYSTFHDIVDFMNVSNIDCICGCTNERVTIDGSLQPILPGKNIFEQFPDINHNLFCMPKIAIIRAKYYKCIGVGHHYIEDRFIKEYKLVSLNASKTNHFKWNLQGKQRIENWYNIFSDEKFCGWKDVNKYKKMLDVFNSNLKQFTTL